MTPQPWTMSYQQHWHNVLRPGCGNLSFCYFSSSCCFVSTYISVGSVCRRSTLRAGLS